MGRRRRKDWGGIGEVFAGLTEIVDVIWALLPFLVRLPVLLLRLLL